LVLGPMSWRAVLAFSPDGQKLASGEEKAVRVWDLRHPQGAPLVLQQESVQSLAFSPDGHRLAVANPGLHVWELRHPQSAPLVFRNDRGFAAVAFSPDGQTLAAGGEGVWVWHLASVLAERACKFVSRNLTNDEWARFVGRSSPYERTCPDLPSGDGAPKNAAAAVKGSWAD
jgi:WD40 repeat protein